MQMRFRICSIYFRISFSNVCVWTRFLNPYALKLFRIAFIVIVKNKNWRWDDDLLHHGGSSSSTTEAYDCWDDDLLRSLIDEVDLLPDSAVAASTEDEAAVVPRLTTHLGHHHHENEEGPRTTDERELDDEEDLITEFFNHIGGEDDEGPNQDHVHQATEPDHTTLLITIIPFPPSQIIILPVVVGNIGRPRASVLHFLLICLLTIIII
ncbi:hypothetical protein DVH24_001003 [Malus domestica]|uniref:Uncharacterized protein n=1 Tax=Malus domestica TaxID=3750 RepID=A0A498JXZ0_MALDO|nr:hypothetical protein DVH24_001003 [Malus domestica]